MRQPAELFRMVGLVLVLVLLPLAVAVESRRPRGAAGAGRAPGRQVPAQYRSQ
jgi:hypothetical protein